MIEQIYNDSSMFIPLPFRLIHSEDSSLGIVGANIASGPKQVSSFSDFGSICIGVSWT